LCKIFSIALNIVHIHEKLGFRGMTNSYRSINYTTEDLGLLLQFMGLSGTDGSRTWGKWGWNLWAVFGKKAQHLLGKYATVFQAEIYAILACAHEIQANARSEKYICICSDSQVALKALPAAKTTSPLVQKCQKSLNDISTWHSVGLFWVPGHSGV
jgi:ribonuclease HI